MPNASNSQYRSVSSYTRAAYALKDFTKIILYSYAQFTNETRDIVIRNFIARSIVALNGLLHLWRVQDYHDCWLLYRAILDRYFHLESLGQTDTFDQFEEWCFQKRYKYKQSCLNDPELEGKIDVKDFTPSKEDQVRYSEISNRNINWRRPRIKEIAARMNLDFLYFYGYDFASSYVHPTATEGQEDYSRLTHIDTGKFADNQITVIHNAFLVTNMIIDAGLRYSRLQWRRPILEFIEDVFSFLHGGPEKFTSDIDKILHLINNNMALCKETNH